MLETVKNNTSAKIATGFLLIYTIWFAYINLPRVSAGSQLDFFTSTYGILAAWGSFCGFVIAKKWGWMQSVMGRSMIFFSLGLAFQEMGQLAYTYYIYGLNIEVPYPSIGDVLFFCSIPCYSFAVILLAKASGVRMSLSSTSGKLQAVLIPAVMVALSYFIFLQGYPFSLDEPAKTFFDFGYPLGDAIYISLAILTFTLTKNVLGGIMRTKVLLILFALLVQYIADWTFLYQASRGTWSVSGINDYIFLCGYFLMTLALIQFETVFRNLKQG